MGLEATPPSNTAWSRSLTEELEAFRRLVEDSNPGLEALLEARARVQRETRHMLSMSGREGLGEAERRLLEELLDPAASWRERYVERVRLAIASLEAPLVEKLLRKATNALRREVELLAEGVAIPELERARVLTHWRLDLMVLEEGARSCGIAGHHGQLAALESRVQEVGVEVRNLRAILEDEAARPQGWEELLPRLEGPEVCTARINLMRIEALRTWLGQSPVDISRPESAARVIHAVGSLHIQVALQRKAPGLRSLQLELERAEAFLLDAREELLGKLATHVETAEPERAREVLVAWHTAISDAATELLSSIEDWELVEAVTALQAMSERIQAFEYRLGGARPPIPTAGSAEEVLTRRDSLRAARRTLDHVHRDLRSELMEKRLALRLERTIGRRAVVWLETLVLVLIFVVLKRLIELTGARALDYRSLKECCGGGVLGADEDLAGRMAGTKLKELDQAEVTALALLCPFCNVMYEGQQKSIGKKLETKLKVPVVYVTQVLGLGLGLDPDDLGFKLNRVKPKEMLKALSGD